jgi:HK97 family phage portal protein
MGVLKSVIPKIFERREATLKNPPYWILKLFGNESDAGISVTRNNADHLAAYYACRLLFSNTMAMVPLNVYHRHTDGRREMDQNHAVFPLLAKKPNPYQTSFLWRSLHMQNVIDFGNSYSIIFRNSYGNPVELSRPYNDYEVNPFLFRSPDTGQEILFYKVTGYKVPFYASDIIHFRNPINQRFGNNGLRGKSVLTAARESIGLGLIQQKYGAETYRNGGGKRVALSTSQVLKPDTRKALREGWKKRYSGPDRMAEVAILDGGVEVKEIGMNPIDADFLNSRKFTALEVAQFFGLFQPSKIGLDVNSGYNSLEQQSIAFVTDTMLPHVVNWEQELNDKLFSKTLMLDQGRYVKFNLNGLMRGDKAARKEWYRTLFNIGVLSRDEIRALEDLNPIAEGDKYYLQQNLAPADMLAELMQMKYENKKKDVSTPQKN